MSETPRENLTPGLAAERIANRMLHLIKRELDDYLALFLRKYTDEQTALSIAAAVIEQDLRPVFEKPDEIAKRKHRAGELAQKALLGRDLTDEMFQAMCNNLAYELLNHFLRNIEFTLTQHSMMRAVFEFIVQEQSTSDNNDNARVLSPETLATFRSTRYMAPPKKIKALKALLARYEKAAIKKEQDEQAITFTTDLTDRRISDVMPEL